MEVLNLHTPKAAEEVEEVTNLDLGVAETVPGRENVTQSLYLAHSALLK